MIYCKIGNYNAQILKISCSRVNKLEYSNRFMLCLPDMSILSKKPNPLFQIVKNIRRESGKLLLIYPSPISQKLGLLLYYRGQKLKARNLSELLIHIH